MGSCGRLGESPNTWKHFGPELTQDQHSDGRYTWRQLVLYYLLSRSVYYNTQVIVRLGSDGVWDGDYGYAGGVLYGTELDSVTLKRVGLFCFPTKHSTNTGLLRLTSGLGLGLGLGSHSSSHAHLLLATLLSHNIPLPRVH